MSCPQEAIEKTLVCIAARVEVRACACVWFHQRFFMCSQRCQLEVLREVTVELQLSPCAPQVIKAGALDGVNATQLAVLKDVLSGLFNGTAAAFPDSLAELAGTTALSATRGSRAQLGAAERCGSVAMRMKPQGVVHLQSWQARCYPR